MSARRTKNSRVKSAKRRRISLKNKVTTTNEVKVDELLHYDTSLIIKDLKRTMIATLVVFGVLVALYYQL